MRKSILMLSMLLLCIEITTHAQFSILATGNGFEEPTDGYAKIIQQKNGYTSFLHITKKDGINIRIYDAGHKEIVDQSITPKYGKLRTGSKLWDVQMGVVDPIKGVYEINNNLVLFLCEYNEGLTLYRLIIDGKTGNLLKEETIGKITNNNPVNNFGFGFGSLAKPNFYVRKDPESDNYSVAIFNTTESDRNRRIEVIHYNKENEEISRAFYQSPNNAYKYLSFMDLCVRGDKEVVVVAVGMNTAASGGDANGTLLLGSLKAGNTSFDLQKITYPQAGKIKESMIRYNKYKDEYILISVKPDKEKEHKAYKTIIKDLGAEAITTMISASSVNRIANKHYDKKDQFLAIPQILYLNNDRSYSIVFEENRALYYAGLTQMSHPGFSAGPNQHSTGTSGGRSKYTLEDIGVIEYNADGTEKDAYYIPKIQVVKEIPRSIYYSFRDETGVRLDDGNQFKSFFFLNGKNKRYVFINDIAKNQDKIDDGKKVTTIDGLNDCEAYFFEIGNEDNMPKRRLLFEDKNNEKEKDMALFAISDYNRDNNTFVTLKLEHIKGNKEVKLVWMIPQ